MRQAARPSQPARPPPTATMQATRCRPLLKRALVARVRFPAKAAAFRPPLRSPQVPVLQQLHQPARARVRERAAHPPRQAWPLARAVRLAGWAGVWGMTWGSASRSAAVPTGLAAETGQAAGRAVPAAAAQLREARWTLVQRALAVRPVGAWMRSCACESGFVRSWALIWCCDGVAIHLSISGSARASSSLLALCPVSRQQRCP